MTTPRDRIVRRHVEPRIVLAIAALGALPVFAEVTIAAPALRHIARSFPGHGPVARAWVLIAFASVLAGLLAGAGRLCELAGRKRTFEAGAVLFSAAAALCAAAPSLGLLIAARALQALGAALLLPASLALASGAYPATRRRAVLARYLAAGALAAAVAPALGSALVAAWSWRLVFLVSVPPGVAAWALARTRLVESRGARRRPARAFRARAVRAAGATVVLAAAAILASHLTSVTFLAAVCGLALAGGLLLLGSLRAEVPSSEPAAGGVPGDPSGPSPEHALPSRPPALAPRPARPALGASASTGDLLALVPMFASLSASQRAEVGARARTIAVAGGDWLFREGDEAQALYIVRSGRLEVLVDSGGHDEVSTLLAAGDVLGELALLSGSTRSASVRARRDATLIEISRADFERFMQGSGGLADGLSRALGRQLAGSRARARVPAARPTVFALTPLQPDVPFAALARRLAGALEREGSLAVIAPGDAGPERLGELLEEREARHDRVVLLVPEPGGRDPWGVACLRQADRVLALAGRGEPAAWVHEQSRLTGCTLLCAGPLGPGDMTPWVAALSPRHTHRVAAEGAPGAELDALARRLAGSSVGLVLSGGGARGFAHIGVIDELQRAGIVVDRVAGCSMGGFVGAMLAAGMDADEIEARCYEEWVRRQPLNDYTLPSTSLIRGDKIRAMLVRTFEGDIEALPTSFFAVSCDLLTGDLVVHRQGSLRLAVGASMCLPGLAPPIATEGRLLVDGGIRNNLPVDVMAEDDEGPIIACDVTAVREPPRRIESSDSQRARGPRVQAFTEDAGIAMPSLGEVLTRCVVLGSIDTTAAAGAHASLVIRPANDGVGMLEFHQLDRMIMSGRRAARAALEAMPAELLGVPVTRAGTLDRS